ncbi:hypothetical protein FWG95_02540, partial [Candidatus Saccharibacteria bacterium]|nr:hypothetical protein [Candidatus Saccharibacteria bacterium]
MKKILDEINAYVAATDLFVKGDQKLVRMAGAMDFLGNPQNDIKILHIAGTSGKTSTAYFAASLLQASGQRVGLNVSPHAVDERERSMINLQVSPWGTYDRQVREYLALLKSGGIKLSYAEFFFGFLFWMAREKKLDWLVLETAMGGLHDASNVATRSDKICVITDIGLDHTKILGDTIPEITYQKAGIIHHGNEVFMHRQSEEIMAVVCAACEKNQASLNIVPEKSFAGLPKFQSHNASLALAAVEFALVREKH